MPYSESTLRRYCVVREKTIRIVLNEGISASSLIVEFQKMAEEHGVPLDSISVYPTNEGYDLVLTAVCEKSDEELTHEIEQSKIVRAVEKERKDAADLKVYEKLKNKFEKPCKKAQKVV